MDRQGFKLLQRDVLDTDLCCGCGTCVGACPADALRIDLKESLQPICDHAACTGCGLCRDICPGVGYPIMSWLEEAGDGPSVHPQQGPALGFFIGHATNDHVRAEGASGGVATALLLHCLESGLVDDVAVVDMADSRPVVQLTHDPHVVAKASRSKYGPAPLMQIVGLLRERPRRVAVCCTPCQLAGWIKAERRFPKLRESMAIRIGLFCGFVQDYASLNPIARTVGCDDINGASFLGWRLGDYPGHVCFELPNGRRVEKPTVQANNIGIPHYGLNRCFLCPDGGNWLADLSLGDTFGLDAEATLVVCRTQVGRDVLDAAILAGRIELTGMTETMIAQSVVTRMAVSKLLPARHRNAWLARKGRPAPEFDYPVLPKSLSTRISVWRYRLTMWLRRGWRRRWLQNHPRAMERVGCWMYYFPFSLPGMALAIRLVRPLARVGRRLLSRRS